MKKRKVVVSVAVVMLLLVVVMAYLGLGRDASIGSVVIVELFVSIVFAVGIIIWFSRKNANLLSQIGRSSAAISHGQSGATFVDVAGVEEAKEELREVLDFLKDSVRFTQIGARIPKGVLLTGPPGTGKTLLARAVAGEAKVPFFPLVGSSFVEMMVGVGAARVRDLFARARRQAPCIIFIDEIDTVGKRRGSGDSDSSDSEREQTLNQLLSEMDGFETSKNKPPVIVMAATNRPDSLDPALLRAGRFDRRVAVHPPNLAGREAILKLHASRVRLAHEVDLSALARVTPGFVGADLANIVNEAALLAVRDNKQRVEMGHLNRAVERVTVGLESRHPMTAAEQKLVAHHEAGHALVAHLLRPGTVHKISIVPRLSGVGGFVMHLPTEERGVVTRSYLLEQLAIVLGGRAAEYLVFGEVSTGASDDIERATKLAYDIVAHYGMSAQLGPRFFGSELANSGIAASEEVRQQIDDEVSSLLQQAHDRASSLLQTNRSHLIKLAERLLEVELLSGQELPGLTEGAEIPPSQ